MSRTIVIIGGVAGGASAAARLRRLNEEDNIIMLERESMFLLPIAGCLIILGRVLIPGTSCFCRHRLESGHASILM